MPTFNIIKNIIYKENFNNCNIIGKFDLKNHLEEKFVGDIPIENLDWNIGLIFGNSGTGKTTIAKEIFKEYFFNEIKYNNDSIINNMNKKKSLEEIINIFNQVGFSSPPSWLKTYSVLSEGEKMRVNLANAILSEKKIIIFDEFTSVVNREVAKISCIAINKTIKKLNKKFIAISCHEDIIEWLCPDWIFNTNTMEFKKKSIYAQNLYYKFIDVRQNIGKCLQNIII